MKNKKNQKIELEKILDREFKELKKSLKNARHQYHSFYFSTINSNKPSARTVILRDLNDNLLFFNSDIRSSKIQDIYSNPQVSALFYDKERGVQLRINGTAKVNHGNEFARKVWSNVSLQSRKCYMGPFKPGVRLNEWIPNLPEKYLKSDPKIEDSQSGFLNFCSIEISIITLEVLELHYDGHIRFIVDYNTDKEMCYIAT